MKTRAWRKVFAISLGAALFAAGCVISSDDDDDDGSGGTGGSAGTAGTGGSGGTSGSGGTGGSGHVYSCTEAVPTDDAGAPDECITCLHKSNTCCAEFLNCANNDKSTPCWGTNSEFFCIQSCIVDIFNDKNAVTDDEKLDCVGSCSKGSTISDATNDLFACVNAGTRADGGTGTGCAVECFGN